MKLFRVIFATTLLTIMCFNSYGDEVKERARKAVELGWSYFHKGDLGTALKRFNQALIIDKNFAPAYFGIAYVYSLQNKLDLAIENYKKSIELDPSYSHSYSNLGLDCPSQICTTFNLLFSFQPS